jgi:hypothetical protein
MSTQLAPGGGGRIQARAALPMLGRSARGRCRLANVPAGRLKTIGIAAQAIRGSMLTRRGRDGLA